MTAPGQFERRATWRRGEGQQRSRGCVVLTHPGDHRSKARAERVVAAGIDDDERSLAFDLLQSTKEEAQVDALFAHVARGLYLAIDREQVVAPLHLGRVAG